jgi:hypothetical protein
MHFQIPAQSRIKIVDVKTEGNDDFIPALSFHGFGHGPFPNTPNRAVTLQVQISLKNVGHSVAEISVEPRLYLPLWGNGDRFFEKVLAEQKKACERSSMPKQIGLGEIVFPDDPYEWNAAVSYPVTIGTIDYLRGLNSANSFPRIIKTNPNGYVIPAVIVCVNYRLRTRVTIN